MEEIVCEYQRKFRPGFSRLVQRVHEEFGFALDPLLDADLDNPERHYQKIWVLLDQGRVVGSVALKQHDGFAELKRMYLYPDYRHKGWGKKLMSTALDWAQDRGYASVRLDTNRHQQDARRLYEKFGFQRVKERADPKRPNMLYYEKKFELHLRPAINIDFYV